MSWLPAPTRTAGGFFTLVVTPPGKSARDATFIRGVPTIISQYTSADPFGWSTAVLNFGMFTGYDDPQGEMGEYIYEDTMVDIYWFPASNTAYAAGHYPLAPPTSPTIVDPLTQTVSLYPGEPTIVWSGHMVSIELQDDGQGYSVQCQGALYQADGRLAKPWFPPRPWVLEQLIAVYLNPVNYPELRWNTLKRDTFTQFPAGWSKVGAGGQATVYTPMNLRAGQKWTGYSSRSTGSWNKALSGFIADLLAVMWTQDDSGSTPGNQWTLFPTSFTTPSYFRDATPVLQVRDRFRAPDFSIWYGTPGINFSSITRDTTGISNVIYGSGTGVDGSEWSNAVVNNDGTMTTYIPLAQDPRTKKGSPAYDTQLFVHEEMYKFPSGVGLDQALSSANKTLPRDSDPGYTSTMTVSIDPEGLDSRYHIRPGMVINIKGILGSGEDGINFHIAEVSVDPERMTVTAKIDTRFRDLLNLEEALARTRDVMTPAKLLQVNRKSVLVEDIMAPWNYSAGSGYIPKSSLNFHKSRPATAIYPWTSWTKRFPPKGSGAHFYVKIPARQSKSQRRWAGPIPIVMSQKGTIRHSEFAVFDEAGNLLKIPFHVGIYYINVTSQDMPHSGTNFDPFTKGFFESIQDNGQPKAANDFTIPDPSLIVGWGNHDQPAGYSPGRKSDGGAPTGKLVDDAAWTYDMVGHNQDFDPNLTAGKHEPTSAITLYLMAYAHYSKDVYLLGRLYRQEPGA